MLPMRLVRAAQIACLWACGAGLASGQGYPKTTVRIVTLQPGGSANFAARVIAEGIAGSLGQPVIVDNRATSIITAEIVVKAPPDGHTLLVGASSFLIGSLLQTLSYDPVKDFVPITLAVKECLFLVVHPTLPVTSVRELIAFARTRPGKVNYSSAGTGGTSHLAAELFKSMAGVDVVRIPYKSAATELPELLAGQTHMTFGNASMVLPQFRSGKLRAIAVTGAQPSSLAPELPTVAAILPGFEAIFYTGFYAPAGTPVEIVNRLHRESTRVLNRADVKERLFSIGTETVASTPEQSAAIIRAELARWGRLIDDVGIRVD